MIAEMTRKNSCVFWSLTMIMLWILTACYQEETVNLVADFDVSVVNNDYSVPVEISIKNNSLGADRYVWTFEGGVPGQSTEKQPGNIWYRTPGTYRIQLECWYKDRSEIKDFTIQLDSVIQLSFDTHILINPIAPVEVSIDNQSSGSLFYHWTFEGGIPEQSNEKHPPSIRYDNPGEYTIRLEAGNEREKKEITRSIVVLPRMETGFAYRFSFEDEDRQAPAVVDLENQSIGVLWYKWEATGGKIDNDTARNTSIYFENPGEYEITLHTDNDKETQSVKQRITVLPNTNLLSLENLRFGVNSSKKQGYFFSGYYRKTFIEEEIEDDEGLGKQIDLVFFGLNSRFTYCRFLSPDSAGIFTFQPIPDARKTYVVNDISKTGTGFSLSDFQTISNDTPLRSLNIKENDTGSYFFELNTFPYPVLFETDDGRKGVLVIKKKVENGTESYIEADLKMQKEPVILRNKP